LAAIEDIQYLFVHPGDTVKIERLTQREAQLAQDKTKIDGDFNAAEEVLGLKLNKPKIPALPTLSGT
jgi:hypothetical protein